jgi:hypothetical protein
MFLGDGRKGYFVLCMVVLLKICQQRVERKHKGFALQQPWIVSVAIRTLYCFIFSIYTVFNQTDKLVSRKI